MCSDQIKEWVGFAREQTAPWRRVVSPYDICYKLGIEVILRDTENDGYLICKGGSKILLISSRIHDRHRQRFIAAHELGHFLLHGETMYCCANLKNFGFENLNSIDQEYQANQFASELLLPEEDLISELPCGVVNFDIVSQLADAFNVSMTMCVRKSVLLSKAKSELLLFYAKDKLLWHTEANEIQEKSNEFVKRVRKYSELEAAIGRLPKWKGGDISSNKVEYFVPYGNQRLVLIPNIDAVV